MNAISRFPRATQLPLDRSACTKLIRNKFIKLAIEPAFLRGTLPAVFAGMRAITDRPDAEKRFPWQKYPLDSYGEKYVQETGVKHETRDGENKFVFQYTSERFPASGEYRAFFGALKRLEDRAVATAKAIALALDGSSAYGASLHQRLTDCRVITRGLRYLRRPDGVTSDAYLHTDRGHCSIAWGATHQGLVLHASDAGAVRINETELDSMAFFFGRKFAAMCKDPKEGCLHGVQYERSVSDEDRISVVSFIHGMPFGDEAAWLIEHDDDIRAHQQSFPL